MKSNGLRPFSFLSGIFLGMLAALGLFFLILNDFNPFKIFSDSGNESRDTVVISPAGKISTTLSVKKPVGINQKTEIPTETDSFSVQPPSTDSLQLIEDSGQGEIVVRRDELLDVKPLTLIIQDKLLRTKSDSLIRNFQGEQEVAPDYRIEFWKSPVNFKGFKFVRNAVVVFGLDPNEQVKLYSADEKLFLRQGSVVYKLYVTEKFEPFSRVTDETLLKQLR